MHLLAHRERFEDDEMSLRAADFPGKKSHNYVILTTYKDWPKCWAKRYNEINMFGLVNNMLFPDTHYGGTNTGTLPSFPSCEWQFVCLFVRLLKRKDNAEFIHSLLPYNNATYILKYCQYNKQSAEQWLQSERKSASFSNCKKLN